MCPVGFLTWESKRHGDKAGRLGAGEPKWRNNTASSTDYKFKGTLSTQSYHLNSYDKPKREIKATKTFDPKGRKRESSGRDTGAPRARQQTSTQAYGVLRRGGPGLGRCRGSSTARRAAAVTAARGRDTEPHTQRRLRWQTSHNFTTNLKMKKVISLNVIMCYKTCNIP